MDYPKIPPSREEKIEAHTKTFRLFDKEKKGFIPMRKLALAVRAAGHNPTIHILREMKREADPRETGMLTLEAYISVLLNHEVDEEEELKTAFKAFDLNGDGVISSDELRKGLSTLGEDMSKEDIEELITLADVNGDGTIDYEEFCVWMTSDAMVHPIPKDD